MTSNVAGEISGRKLDDLEDSKPKTLDQRARIERLTTLGTFALGIAHELASPIGSLQLAARHALETTDLDRRDELLRAILKDAMRCSSVIDSLSRFMSEGVVAKQPVNLRAIVARCEDRLREEGHGVTVALNAAPDAQTILCHAPAIEQALCDLFRNAVQATGRSTHIEIAASKNGELVDIVCQDDGPGIPETALERVFEPFYTTRALAGMGLGLSIARNIVIAHGGKLRALPSSAGARFLMQLPAEA